MRGRRDPGHRRRPRRHRLGPLAGGHPRRVGCGGHLLLDLDLGEGRPAGRRQQPSATPTSRIAVGGRLRRSCSPPAWHCSPRWGSCFCVAGQSHGGTKAYLITIGVVSVALSWTTVHTVFMLRYTRSHYQSPGGAVDFNEKDAPAYLDFAYLAFTVGMTFQVSDTNLTTKAMRRSRSRTPCMSYLFGRGDRGVGDQCRGQPPAVERADRHAEPQGCPAGRGRAPRASGAPGP